MRKHIFGFLLFSSIVVAFVLVFAYFYAPEIPKITDVTRPNFESNASYQVQSVQYDLERRKLISRIRFNWFGEGPPPKNLWMYATISDDRRQFVASLPAQELRDPFKNGNEVYLTLEMPFSSSQNISREDNYYAKFEIYGDCSATQFSNSIAVPVLFVHGEESKIAQ